MSITRVILSQIWALTLNSKMLPKRKGGGLKVMFYQNIWGTFKALRGIIRLKPPFLEDCLQVGGEGCVSSGLTAITTGSHS